MTGGCFLNILSFKFSRMFTKNISLESVVISHILMSPYRALKAEDVGTLSVEKLRNKKVMLCLQNLSASCVGELLSSSCFDGEVHLIPIIKLHGRKNGRNVQ